MAKITAISLQQNSTEFQPRNFTQVGGIYGDEIRPEEYLISADITQCTVEGNVEQVNGGREPRFFRVR
jgi:hypothetical protein